MASCTLFSACQNSRLMIGDKMEWMNELDEITAYGREHQIPILMDESLSLIKKILKEYEHPRFLEIGTAIGRTSLMTASIDPSVRVVTIERDEDMIRQAEENFKNSPYAAQITFLKGDAREVEIPEGPYDVIFIDAAKSQYKRFFERVSPMLAENGVIISDNMFFHGLVEHPERTHNRHTKGLIRRLKQYTDYLTSLDGFETSILDIGDGVALTRRINHA